MKLSTLALCSSLVMAAASLNIPRSVNDNVKFPRSVDVLAMPRSGVQPHKDLNGASFSGQLLYRTDSQISASFPEHNLTRFVSTLPKITKKSRRVKIVIEEDEDEDEDGEDEESQEGGLLKRGRRHRHDRSGKHSGRRQKSHHHDHDEHYIEHKAHHKLHQFDTASSSGSGPFEGKGTFFQPNQGACGNWNTPQDKIVALSSDIYQSGSHCGQKVHICHGDKCADAVVADLCPGCKHTSLDMTESLFKEFAPLDIGVIDIKWSFV